MSEEILLEKIEQMMDVRFNKLDVRFDRIDYQIDLIARKVAEHSEEFVKIREEFATKAQVNKLQNTVDFAITKFHKQDEEILHAQRQLREHDGRIEKVEKKLKIF